mmetsp:Transcript_33728/g.73661  ORF Transcript_33728/g.73661 Transcript_33728/m.73661 type:complete len:220 (-) Transcript_33728:394-1053(-)
MVCIILMLFISAGSESMMVCGVPAYIGSSDFSSVVRYLTLSFASFAASVTRMSIAFQLRCACVRPAIVTPITSLLSFDLSCSVMELNLAMRLRQYSSSVSGPTSSACLRACPALLLSLWSSRRSTCSHQLLSTISKCPAVLLSDAALLKAAGLRSMAPTNLASGFFSSTPPSRLDTASASVLPNFWAPVMNSWVWSSWILPHPSCFCRMGRKMSERSPR